MRCSQLIVSNSFLRIGLNRVHTGKNYRSLLQKSHEKNYIIPFFPPEKNREKSAAKKPVIDNK